MEIINDFWTKFNHILDFQLVNSESGLNLSLGDILHFIIFTALVLIIAKYIRYFISHRLFKTSPKLQPYGSSIGNIARYITLVLGFMIVVHSMGLNLSSLYVIFGSLGVGIGIGLQNITENFVSGILIMFERPVKVGDRIDVNGISGIITNIEARATSVLTNDNISIILPNSYLTNQQVTNWSHNNHKIRLRFPVGVSYKEDPEKVKEVLLKIVEEHHGILKQPTPQVLFTNFGESSLDFSLDVWTESYLHKFDILQSEVYFEIFKQFKLHQIEIPFPQRDLHIKTDHTKS
ncbi:MULTISPECIES: mechanosensitive ion channel family protein [Persicobacter]|uniref:Mechanosensitive ion channel protein MscS n=1 Tax=Persicobacter diffluens TaxID=981 RepID=A0AAN5AKY6_9BACT|nr:mechanosensitive ion channel domain-containing protein [Persicobacter sp. CCB-QB2]GJM60911.1 mechanosensitive ion channel protein MscS [Persicobacter diffluens]